MSRTLDDLAQALIAAPEKRALYGQDIQFLQALMTLERLFVSALEPALDALRASTAIVFKPDAFAAGKVEAALALLAGQGFTPIAQRAFRYDRNMIVNAWRYQINIATAERMEVVEALLGSAPSLYVLLRHPDPPGGDASTFISTLKGPAEVRDRHPDCLRSRLGDHNTFLNKIHLPDETADFLRELCIYFPPADMDTVLCAAVDGAACSPAGDMRAMREAMAAETPARSLAFEGAMTRLLAQLEAKALLSLARRVQRAARSNAIDTAAIRGLLAADVDAWDRLIVMTQLVRAERPGARKILEGVSGVARPAQPASMEGG